MRGPGMQLIIDWKHWMGTLFSFVIYYCLAITLPAANLPGAERSWVRKGPYNGAILSLAIDPQEPQTIYASTKGGGVFKSMDGASRWNAINSGLNADVRCIGISPDNPQILFAGTLNQLFRSTDGGNSWAMVLSGSVTALAIDPNDPQTIYVGQGASMSSGSGTGLDGGIMKSTDSGTSWKRLTNDLLSPGVGTLAIDPSTPPTIYATINGRIVKSADGGDSWSEAGSTGSNVLTFAVDPSTPQTVYAGTEGGVYKSINGGNQWRSLGLLYVPMLAIDPLTPQTIYACTYSSGTNPVGSLYKSTDGGNHWQIASLSGSYRINALAMDPSSPQTIYVGTEEFLTYEYQIQNGSIFKSTDAGNNWKAVGQGPTNDVITALAIDPSSPRTIYAVGDRDGVLKSTNSGASWNRLNTGIDLPAATLAIDPSSPQTIYAGGAGVFKSTDGGAHWPSRTLIGKSVSAMVIDPSTPQTIYVGTLTNGLFKSTDAGNTWNSISQSLALKSSWVLALDPVRPQTIYASGHIAPPAMTPAIYKSTDGGNNWSSLGAISTQSSFYVHSLAIDPSAPQTIYAGTTDGIFKSTDGGYHWNGRNTGLPSMMEEVHSLWIDPSNPQRLYSGIRNRNSDDVAWGQIFKSMDGGSSWADASAGLGAFKISTLAFDATIPQTLYAGTTGGIWSYSFAPGLSSYDVTLGEGGAAAITTPGIGKSVQTGYSELEVSSDTKPYGTAVFAYKLNGVTVSEAAVPTSPPTTHVRVFIDHRAGVPGIPGRSDSGEININTGIGIVNESSDLAHITYTLLDAEGTAIATGKGALAAGNHEAKFIDQINDISSGFILPSNLQFASLDIASDQPLSVIALRMTINQRGESLFTTTPVADLSRPLTGIPSYFPQLADGSGWTTSLMLLNTSSSSETGSLNFFDNSGQPLDIHPVGGSPASSLRYSISPGGLFRFQTDGSFSNQKVGWVRLNPDDQTSTPIGAGVFGFNPVNVLTTESGIPSLLSTTHARIFIDLSGKHNTGLAVANLDAAASNITIRAFQTDGKTPEGESQELLQLAALGHDAKFVTQIISGLPENFMGILDVSSSTPFAAVTIRSLYNEREDFLISTFPVADVTLPAPSPILFPHVADGEGYTTQFILLSPEGTENMKLTLYDEMGKPLVLDSPN
jgi:photosystem II stability/assembly factor-like uncharacterized protein